LTFPVPYIVSIGGTTRAGSSSELAIRNTLRFAQNMGARTDILCSSDLVIESYDPTVEVRSHNAQRLVQLMREADGIILASPSYHGSIPGVLKNALDFTEDLRSDERPYFDGRAVGCIVCAEGVQALGSTLFTLRSIVHALRGWPTPYACTIVSSSKPFGPDGKVHDDLVASQLKTVAEQVVQFAQKSLLVKSLLSNSA